MSLARAKRPGGWAKRLLGTPGRVACCAAVVLFLWAVSKFYDPATGFTSLIEIGDKLGENKVSQLKQVPHYIYTDSYGYDGAYYVQLALNPTLDNPELKTSIDNLPYRAKRILFCWIAWLAGLGQAEWVVQAHALLNVVCWLALAWLLLRWFPPTDWESVLRWFAVMFSHGVCMSVRLSLVDAPSLLLVALAMRWVEDGRRGAGIATLALAGLGKETSLLAVAGVADFDWRAPRTWWRPALTALVVALPLFAWMGYIRWTFGPADDTGFGNFTLPLAGLVEKWNDVFHNLQLRTDSTLRWATLAAIFALTVQWLFFVLRWRPSEAWWRLGAAYAGMLIFLSTPVWEGFPGASTRVLLPMTLAFNICVPRGRKWLAVLIAGNLTVVASYREFSPPSRDFMVVSGARAVLRTVRVEPISGWSGNESNLGDRWRWCAGDGVLRIRNDSGGALTLALQGAIASAHDQRRVKAVARDDMRWSAELSAEKTVEFRFGVVAPPGETLLHFTSDQPGHKIGTDPRALAFKITNLEVVVKPSDGAR